LTRPTGDADLAGLPDQVEYLELGRNVLQKHQLVFVDPRFAQDVHAFRMPGYPLFIAACGGDVRVIRAVQIVLDTLSVLGVFLLASRLMPGHRGPALAAAAIVACNPYLIYFTGLVLSETLFIFMLVWGMMLLLAGFGSGDRPGRSFVWLAGGLLLAMATLVRPSAAFLPILLGVGGLFVNQRSSSAYHSSPHARMLGRWPLPVATTMLLLVGLCLMPWMLRNYRVTHQLIWTDTNSGFTLYDGFNPDATGASDQRFVRYMPQLRLMTEIERSQYLSARAITFIRKNPQRVAELAAAKAGRTWSPMPLSEQFGTARYAAIGLLYSIPFDLMVIVGLWHGNLPRRAKVYLLIPAIYLTVVHALTVGSLRYRVPAEPALAVLAASVLYRPSFIKR
jgi:4-amino-4-deoxy-L-arabinose transferase-like glycosyltransferase